MAYNTLLQQGRFVSTGNNVFIPLRGGVDSMEVINFTQWGAAAATATGVKFEWFNFQANGGGFEYQNEAGTNRILARILTTGGFTFVDTSSPATVFAPQNTTVTAISTSTPPIVSLTSTAGLASGQTVIFNNIAGAPQFDGIPFTIDTIVTNTSFRLPYAPTLSVAGTTANFYPYNYSPTIIYPNFQPSINYITAITAGLPTVIKLSVSVQYVVGQTIRINNPDSANGMPQINGLSGTITAVDTTLNTISVNIDSTGFAAFAFPAAGAGAFTPATVVPFGEGQNAVISNPNLLSDSVANDAQIGMILFAGINSPAGQAADVIYWKAFKSFNS